MPARLALAVLIVCSVPAERPAATPVTLAAADRPVAELARAVGGPARVTIDTAAVPAGRTATLKLDAVPFWSALEELARAADCRLDVQAANGRVTLGPGPYRPAGAGVDGPFRVWPESAAARTDYAAGRRATELTLAVCWEPRWRAYLIDGQPTLTALRDQDGRELPLPVPLKVRSPAAGRGAVVQVVMSDLPRSVQSLREVAGAFNVLGSDRTAEFTFDPARPASQSKDGVTVRFAGARQSAGGWLADVEVRRPAGGVELESFQAGLIEPAAALVGPGGKESAGTVEESDGELTRFRFAGPPDGRTLAVRVPVDVREARVTFRLAGVQLP